MAAVNGGAARVRRGWAAGCFALSALAAGAAGQPASFNDPMDGSIHPDWRTVCVYTCDGLVGGVTPEGFAVTDVLAGTPSGEGNALVWPRAGIERDVAPTDGFVASAVLSWEGLGDGTDFQQVYLEVLDDAGCLVGAIGYNDSWTASLAASVLHGFACEPNLYGALAGQAFLSGQEPNQVGSATVTLRRASGGPIEASFVSGGDTFHYTPQNTGAGPATRVRISFARWVDGQIGRVSVRSVSFEPEDTCPAVVVPPADESACRGGTASFSVVARGEEPLSYRWRMDGVELQDGAGVEGAGTAMLTVSQLSLDDAGAYDCVVTNACGDETSEAGVLSVCAGDFDCDGALGVTDFTAFRAAYLAGDMAADYSGDGVLGVTDFTAFRTAYLAGCA